MRYTKKEIARKLKQAIKEIEEEKKQPTLIFNTMDEFLAELDKPKRARIVKDARVV